MIAQARFSCRVMAQIDDIAHLSSAMRKGAQNWHNRCCQAPTCDRSTDAALGCVGAVRDRALRPSPAAARTLARCSLTPPSLVLCLTPTRWRAMKLRGHRGTPIGPGGAVPNGTRRNPFWNHQHIEKPRLFARFHKFHGEASRDVRVGPCAAARVHVRGTIIGTLEPSLFIVRYEEVSGSKAGSKRFQLGTVACASLESGGFARFPHILGARYRRAHGGELTPSFQGSLSTVLRGRGGENFGVSLAGDGADPRDLVELDQAGRNGGFARFRRVAWGHVGRAMLEGVAQRLDPARFSGAAREPVRLGGEGPGGSIGRATPPLPPSPTRAFPSTLAHDGDRIWIGLRPAQSRRMTGATEDAQRWEWQNGSGCGRIPLTRRQRTGRGRNTGGLAGKLRRDGDASGRPAHVN